MCHNIAPSAAPFDSLYLAVCEKNNTKQNIDVISVNLRNAHVVNRSARPKKQQEKTIFRVF
jgi:hypothetical protein